MPVERLKRFLESEGVKYLIHLTLPGFTAQQIAASAQEIAFNAGVWPTMTSCVSSGPRSSI